MLHGIPIELETTRKQRNDKTQQHKPQQNNQRNTHTKTLYPRWPQHTHSHRMCLQTSHEGWSVIILPPRHEEHKAAQRPIRIERIVHAGTGWFNSWAFLCQDQAAATGTSTQIYIKTCRGNWVRNKLYGFTTKKRRRNTLTYTHIAESRDHMTRSTHEKLSQARVEWPPACIHTKTRANIHQTGRHPQVPKREYARGSVCTTWIRGSTRKTNLTTSILPRHKEHKAAQRPTAKQHDLPENPPLAITPAWAPGAAKGEPKGHETRNKLSNNTQLHKRIHQNMTRFIRVNNQQS